MNARWVCWCLVAFLVVAPVQAGELGTPDVRTEARLARAQKPGYPREALQQGVEGQVIVWISISAEGDVLDAKVHRSSGSALLDDHTVRFARRLEFVPARRGQTPIPTTVLLPVQYRLLED
jgi:protein TonB